MKQLGINDVSTYLTHLLLSDMPVSKSDITVKDVAVAWEKNVTADVLRSYTDPNHDYAVREIYERVQEGLLSQSLPKYEELSDGVKRGFAQRFKKFLSTKKAFDLTYIKGSPNNYYRWANTGAPKL